jgi:uncharacterized protein HemY
VRAPVALARGHLSGGEPEAARAALARVLERNPQHPEALELLDALGTVEER